MTWRSHRTLARALGLSLAWQTGLAAEGIRCPDIDVTVLGADERADDICKAVATTVEQLKSCNLTVQGPITVEIVHSLPNCLGLYHCDDALIQLLSIEAYGSYLSRSPDSLFNHLAPGLFFESVLRHELARAALESMPCPFEGCPATTEFIAYTMQIWFLPDAARAFRPESFPIDAASIA